MGLFLPLLLSCCCWSVVADLLLLICCCWPVVVDLLLLTCCWFFGSMLLNGTTQIMLFQSYLLDMFDVYWIFPTRSGSQHTLVRFELYFFSVLLNTEVCQKCLMLTWWKNQKNKQQPGTEKGSKKNNPKFLEAKIKK